MRGELSGPECVRRRGRGGADCGGVWVAVTPALSTCGSKVPGRTEDGRSENCLVLPFGSICHICQGPNKKVGGFDSGPAFTINTPSLFVLTHAAFTTKSNYMFLADFGGRRGWRANFKALLYVSFRDEEESPRRRIINNNI